MDTKGNTGFAFVSFVSFVVKHSDETHARL